MRGYQRGAGWLMPFVEENTGEEVENALTKGPEIWVLVLALLVRWKGQHCLSEPQIPHQ